MALNKDAKNQYRVKLWDEDEGTNPAAITYSDAIFREYYGLHSVHVKIDGTAEVTLQLSLLESPAENSDDDWVDLDPLTASAIVRIDPLFRWIRAKRDATTDPVTVVILSGSRTNN